MNEKNGLSTLPNKSIDLCLTDPPFNIKFKSKQKKFQKRNKIYYDDYLEPDKYENWCKTWFKEVNRICKTVIIHVGKPNLNMWYKISNPIDIFFWYKKNQSLSMTRSAYLCVADPFLFYGKNSRRLAWDVLEINMSIRKEVKVSHPCPLSEKITFRILDELRPKTVLDPFLGSGTIAESCIKLGIKWFGYEKEKRYSNDIDKRLKNCKPIKRLKQNKLEILLS